ncbi:6-phospho 3-hexuloisomerase [Mycobacterium sp. CBMA 234]|uniref:6-phospho-3-hexuloisomerase n=1 Tax=Mycolicibacterium sp. CBMA 234 TaxID=1918495 RepID=UPI0012DC16A7|nr:6-phospho-3-hexuloisomerase [Mycolicibacterium sp. CBMA 234]MUL63323.1 6-phospho 3-hexuloisomerase [Mycolicibacterium sp. CBMA 234]
MTVTTDLGARVTGDALTGNLSLVGDEITATAAKVDVQQVADLARLLTESTRVFAAGAGRSGLVLRMAAMRLMHLGLNVHIAGDTTTPAINEGDLLLVASGSGTTSGIVKSADTAKKAGAKVATFTTNAESPLAALSDAVVIIPAAQKTDHGSNASRQYAGSLFEQVLFVVTDAVFQSLWDHADIQAEELWLRHANLE